MMNWIVRLALSLGVAAGLFGFVGCDKKSKSKKAKAEKPKEKEEPQKQDKQGDQAGAETKPHSSDIPGTPNQLEWDQDIPDVKFEIVKPEDGAVLKSGKKVEVQFDLEGYRIGKMIGQHVHFVLDNKPYSAHYTDGEPQVFKNLEPGTHTLRAFPSRHYHLSLKKNRPFDTVVFHVKEKSKDFEFDPAKPYLTYSRPKGTYSKNAARNLMLDFYVSNVQLGKKHKVVYSVDGEKRGELKEWKPRLLSLKPGEHDVNLRLVDSSGNLVENGGYNDTTRTITVKE